MDARLGAQLREVGAPVRLKADAPLPAAAHSTAFAQGEVALLLARSDAQQLRADARSLEDRRLCFDQSAARSSPEQLGVAGCGPPRE